MRPTCRITWHLRDGSARRTDGYGPLNLLAHAEVFGLTIPQACGGKAECGTCRVQVVAGELTPPTPDERLLREEHRRAFADDERLACQARPRGDVAVALRGATPPDLREEPPS